ncbi:MAG: hypothetical protein A2664_03375 [Candidatus Taylorbacteria bacterium RIFCSPHIGHO2_01_FULL_46_22b]|uniref:Segregation and condensation protein A n=1 Tax=Candidatus Taylorbacteria bacterium RIFCSPHIGHO2_01_FULL_46_22b TaxID=1802301 RepID=A0A1G2M169_9BACT|nr:MAG: hypothetical protein A2664_03375 [Candidatus Taylorbacteria bacterium RIFCSPHIGHO2_01_FULL_46_22b]
MSSETLVHAQKSFTVKTPSFEGPLDLLLDLIEKRKLAINEVSLSKVADDYISYIQSLSEFPIASSAHFILIASTLLLIKSKSLLPSLALSEEEQGSIADLERRLKMYARARELSKHIRLRFGREIIFGPEQRIQVTVFSPDKLTSSNNLSTALRELLHKLPKASVLAKAIVQKVVSLEEMITNLTERIKSNLKLNFKEFASIGKKEKVHIIVSFLAMLELVKQGIISVKQDGQFDDIVMETEKLDVPSYK